MKRPLRNRVIVILIYLALLVGGIWIGMQWERIAKVNEATFDPDMMTWFLIFGLIAFALTSALPFVPGAEIGLGLLVLFGGKVAVFVYGAIVCALTLAYLVGAAVPPQSLARFFASLGFKRAHDLVARLAEQGRRERLDVLLSSAPPKWLPVLLRHRYLALAVLFNVPGNSLIGGGGGIALAAGMSGFFRFPLFVLAIAIAVAPVPLFFHFTM